MQSAVGSTDFVRCPESRSTCILYLYNGCGIYFIRPNHAKPISTANIVDVS